MGTFAFVLLGGEENWIVFLLLLTKKLHQPDVFKHLLPSALPPCPELLSNL